MTLEDYAFIRGMLQDFRGEAQKLEVQIAEHLGLIREAEAHLRAFEDKEPEDKKVFSPRRTEALHKERMDRIKEEKASHEESCREMSARKAVIDRRVERIESVLSHEEKELSSHKEAEEGRRSAALKSMEELIDRIEKSSSYMERNPVQARQDLAIIAKSLREAVDDLW